MKHFLEITGIRKAEVRCQNDYQKKLREKLLIAILPELTVLRLQRRQDIAIGQFLMYYGEIIFPDVQMEKF